MRKCVCKQGYYLIGGSCKQCPVNSIYDETHKFCKPICSINEQYDFSLRKCICKDGYYIINGQCRQCPVNSIYDSSLSICRPICGVN